MMTIQIVGMLLLSVLSILFSIYAFYKASISIKKMKYIKNNYKKTIGTVICNAYGIYDSTKVIKAVTPIVEYEVNGQTYEVQNEVLSSDAELKVGTKIYIYYNEKFPTMARISTDLTGVPISILVGNFLFWIGLGLLFTCF